MWARKQIDILWRDLALGLLTTALPIDLRRLTGRIEALWAPAGDGLACLSVRSGLDLLLSVLQLPHGAEILMTAVTIDDMRRVVAAHGLTAVPVDLDPANLSPTVDALDRATSPRTRAIVVAHLFGGRVDLEPIVAWARLRGILVIEDCAQAFCGPADRGHLESDVAMFSFGSIKTCTALGGALLRVRDQAVLARMRSLQSTWPIQRRGCFAAKVIKYAALKFLSGPWAFACFVRGCRQLGYDYDRLLNGWVRGFAAADLLDRLRRQPSAPLLALLLHRLRTFDPWRLARRSAKGSLLAAYLKKRCQEPFLAPLGGHAQTLARRHTHWVFPILCDEPDQMIAALVAVGFDANRGGSMVSLAAPPDRPELQPAVAAAAIRHLVYLSCYADMPDRELARMATVVNQIILQQSFAVPRSPTMSASPPPRAFRKPPSCPTPPLRTNNGSLAARFGA